MTRKNKSVPIWNGKRWRYRTMIDGVQRNFYSTMPGSKGETECYKKADKASQGQAARKDKKIGDLWVEYLEHVEFEYGATSESLRSATKYGKNHILPKCKHKRLNQMSTLDWQAIINKAKPVRVQTKSKRATLTESGELSKKTLMNLRSEIVAFLKWCRRGDLTTLNPELTIPRNRETVKRDVLTTDEAITLLATRISPNDMLHAFRLQMTLGLRPGEVLALKKTDIEGDYLKIRRSFNDTHQFTKGKNENAERLEYLHPLAKQIVDDQLKYITRQGIKSQWLFPRADGSIHSQGLYRTRLKDYCKEAGFTEITPYRLRHSFISIMRSRVPEDTIKAIVGHSKAMDTFGVYDAALKENVALQGGEVGQAWENLIKLG